MASGSFESNNGTNLNVVCRWSSVPNNESGTSRLLVELYLKHYDIYSASLEGSYIKVGDDVRYFSKGVTDSDNILKETLLCREYFTVSHNPDGRKTVPITCSWLFRGTYGGVYISSVEASRTVTLDTLPRASKISSLVGGTLGQTLSVAALVYSPSFSHKVRVDVGGESYQTGTLSSGTLSFSLPLSLAYGMTGERSKSARVTLLTYDAAGNLVGENFKDHVISVGEGDDFLPSFDFAVTPYSESSYIMGREIFASGVSMADAVITNAAGKLGASITSYEIKLGSERHATNNFRTDYLEAGSYAFTAVVTDSRGLSRSVTRRITVDAYFAPYFTYVDAFRCDADGTESDAGTKISLEFDSAFFPLDGDNTTYTEARVLRRDGTEIGRYVVSEGERQILNCSLSPETSYTLRLIMRDSAGKSAQYEVKIPTKRVDMHMRCGSVRFGGLIEKEGFDCSMDADFTGDFSLGGTKVEDFTEAHGESGIWKWRKWKSGEAECYGTVPSKTYSVRSAWGSLFRSGENSESDNSAQYPENLFCESPLVFADVKRTGLSVFAVKRNNGTKDICPSYFVVSPTAGDYDCALHIFAKGRWK